ncbi:MAG: DinB family protein [Chloroflexota bacterium]
MTRVKEQHLVHVLPSNSDEIGRALWQLNETRQRLIETVETLELATLEWRPEAEANSIGTLLYHIAIIEMDWLFVEVLQRPFPPHLEALFSKPDRDSNGRLTLITGDSISTHLDRLKAVRQALLDAFSKLMLDDFRRPRSFEPYDVTPEWVIFHLLEHEIEHRGHIQERLRQYQQLNLNREGR